MSRSKRREEIPRDVQRRPAVSMPDMQRPRTFPIWLVCMALVIVVFVAFGGVLSGAFVNYDDDIYITENVNVQAGLTGESVEWAFRTTEAANWHPVTWLSHMLDVQLFGLDAGRHHLTSVTLHALNVALLLLVLFRMTGALWRSAFVAALFAIHPLHVESVVWVAERKDVLSTLFWLLALASWLGFVRARKLGWYVLALAFFALGLMSKPMLVTLPFTLLLLDFWPLGRVALPLQGQGRTLRALVLEKVPLFVLSAASSVVTFVVQKSGGSVMSSHLVPFHARAANALISYISYVGKTLWPTSLSVFYPYRTSGVSPWVAIGAAVALFAATLLAVKLAMRAPYLAVGWLWYIGTLVPVIGLVQVGAQAMADRYTYVPLIGLFVALAWGVADLAGERRAMRCSAAAVAMAVLVLLSVLARRQVGYWKDSASLFGHALAVNADNFVAQNNLGSALFEGGARAEAIAHYREAIRIDPRYPNAHDNLGAALLGDGKSGEALACFREAWRLQPDSPEYCAKTATVLFRLNRPVEAAKYLERAIKADSGTFSAHVSLGTAFQDGNRLAEAQEHFRRALEIKPGSAQALVGLGEVQGRMGQVPEAIATLRRAAEADPRSLDARINLGVALDRLGNTTGAIEQFRNALEIDPGSAPALGGMGMVLVRVGRFRESVEYLQRAAEKDPQNAMVRHVLGVALARERRFQEARDILQEAVRLAPEDAEMRTALAQVQEILRRNPGGLP